MRDDVEIDLATYMKAITSKCWIVSDPKADDNVDSDACAFLQSRFDRRVECAVREGDYTDRLILFNDLLYLLRSLKHENYIAHTGRPINIMQSLHKFSNESYLGIDIRNGLFFVYEPGKYQSPNNGEALDVCLCLRRDIFDLIKVYLRPKADDKFKE